MVNEGGKSGREVVRGNMGSREGVRLVGWDMSGVYSGGHVVGWDVGGGQGGGGGGSRSISWKGGMEVRMMG